MDSLLARLEHYYDLVPRSGADTEQIGPFTLFIRRGQGWPYYARPTLGSAGASAEDIRRVRARQVALEIPEAFEWVEEVTPGLDEAAVAAGLRVTRHPLLVLTVPQPVPPSPGLRVRLLDADPDALGRALATANAAFSGTDEVGVSDRGASIARGVATRQVRVAAAYDEDGTCLGSGIHSPRDGVTELAGIGVLPRARGRGVGTALTAALVADALALGVEVVFLSAADERAAAIYRRVGFAPRATACIGTPADAGPDDLRLLPVREEDWQLVRDLRARVLRDVPDAFGSTWEQEQGYDEDAWRARVARGRTVVAWLGGEPVGLGGIYDAPDGVSWVVSMWTAPEARGLGVGTAVLADVLAHAHPDREVRLWVTADNPAQRLYARAGFVPTGARTPLRPGSSVVKEEFVLRR